MKYCLLLINSYFQDRHWFDRGGSASSVAFRISAATALHSSTPNLCVSGSWTWIHWQNCNCDSDLYARVLRDSLCTPALEYTVHAVDCQLCAYCAINLALPKQRARLLFRNSIARQRTVWMSPDALALSTLTTHLAQWSGSVSAGGAPDSYYSATTTVTSLLVRAGARSC